MEIWKEIEGYEGLYEVSNLGNVKSLISGKILKPKKDKDGYLYVGLYQQGKQKAHKVHRLVAQTFLNTQNTYTEVNHKDEDKTNNIVDNLEWCTRSYNVNYSQSKQVMCVETGIIYSSATEAAHKTGFSQANISMCCLEGRKTRKGLHFKYV